MAKFTITVDVDWIDEDGGIDHALEEAITSAVVQKVSDNTMRNVSEKANELLEKRLLSLDKEISERLNAMMDDFFDTPRDITDSWGNMKREGVCARQLITEAADNFFTETVGEDGKPTSYGTRYTRMEYIAKQAVTRDVTWAVEQAVKNAVDRVRKTVKETATKQLGEKLAEVVGLDSML